MNAFREYWYDDPVKPLTTVTALRLTLDGSGRLDPSRDHRIFVDELELVGPIVLRGRNVAIFARRVNCRANASINVGGVDARSHPISKAEDGKEPGAKGDDGLHGENGGNAGNVIIISRYAIAGDLTIIASGGNGSPGQDGGDGAIGSPGSDGPDHWKIFNRYISSNHYGIDFPVGFPFSDPDIVAKFDSLLSFLPQLTQIHYRQLAKYVSDWRLKQPVFSGTPIPYAEQQKWLTFDKDGPSLVDRTTVARGGAGGLGGAAGEGGKGGQGGVGGQVIILSRDNERPQGLIIYTKGGAGGAPGSNGTAGNGGPGGIPGKSVSVHLQLQYSQQTGSGSFMKFHPFLAIDRSGSLNQSGPAGLMGLIPALPESSGAPGADGSQRIDLVTNDELELACSSLYAQLVFRAGQLAYYNEEHDQSEELFSWLSDLGQASDSQTVDGQNGNTIIRLYGVDQSFSVASLGKRADAHRLQMRAGLNFFGRPRNYMPLLSVSYYQSLTEWLLPKLAKLEELEEQSSAKSDAVTDLVTIDDASKVSVEQIIEQLKADIDQLNKAAEDDGVKSIRLLEEIQHQLQRLKMASNAFVEAASRKNQQQQACDFNRLSGIAVAIAGIASAAYGNYLTAASSLNSIKDIAASGIESFDELRKLVAAVQTVGSSVNEIVAAFDKVNDVLSPAQPNGSYAIILMKYEDVRAITAPYLDLAEAHQLRDAVNLLLQLIQRRNEVRLSYLSKRAKIAVLRTAEMNQTRELARVASQIAGATKTLDNASISAFLGTSLESCALFAAEIMDDLDRAVSYWSMSEVASRRQGLFDFSSIGFNQMSIDLQRRILQSVKNLGGAGSVLENLTIEISAARHPNVIKSFKESGFIVLSVPAALDSAYFSRSPGDIFINRKALVLKELQVHALRLELVGAKSKSGELYFEVTHGGEVEVVDRNGGLLRYVHAPTLASLSFSTVEQKPTTEYQFRSLDSGPLSNEFVGRSPFCSWTIQLSKASTGDADFSGLEVLRLVFPSVTGRP